MLSTIGPRVIGTYPGTWVHKTTVTGVTPLYGMALMDLEGSLVGWLKEVTPVMPKKYARAIP